MTKQVRLINQHSVDACDNNLSFQSRNVFNLKIHVINSHGKLEGEVLPGFFPIEC